MQDTTAVDHKPLFDLMNQSYARHLSVARRFTSDDHDAADLVQESYIRAWRALPRFRGDAALSTWLHAIIVNTCRTWVMRRRHTVPLDDAHDVADSCATRDPAQVTELTELRDEVRSALQQLLPAQRRIIELKDLRGLSHAEIAAELGITETAAKVRLHRARRALRAIVFGSLTEGHVADAA